MRDVDDGVQESYLRVWRTRAGGPISTARAFLFTIARHLAVDGTRRFDASPIFAMEDLARLPVADGASDVAGEGGATQTRGLAQRGLRVLSGFAFP